jgi:prevent-host-death family protein
MKKHYSVAEARTKFPTLIREVEQGQSVEITRRGRPVAVVVSLAEFRRIESAGPTFIEAYESWRRRASPGDTAIERRFIRSLRDRSRGRKADL